MKPIRRYWHFITHPTTSFNWCADGDPKNLEAVNAKLVAALKYAVRIYGRFGAVVNEPYHPGEWIKEAKDALRAAGVRLPEDEDEEA